MPWKLTREDDQRLRLEDVREVSINGARVSRESSIAVHYRDN